MLFESTLIFALGLVLVTGGAELLVRGAGRLAGALGISPLVVGLTVVAFATSAPEAAVSVQAALHGRADVALGNVVGSNVFNVLVVLGLSAIIVPLAVRRQLVRFDVPLMIGVTALPVLLALDGDLDRLEGGLLLVLLIAYLGLLTWMAVRHPDRLARGAPSEPAGPDGGGGGGAEPDAAEGDGDVRGRRVLGYLGMVAGGIVILVVGADFLVEGASEIALALGVSELVVGLTLVAAGTSLPEAATSVVASLRGQRDMAVGNVVGSNIFNVLGVLGGAALAAPAELTVPSGVLTFDFVVMFTVALVCLPVFFTGRVISRWEGGVFLAYYFIYIVYLGLDASEHAARSLFGSAVLYFVIPLTLLAALTGWLREPEPT